MTIQEELKSLFDENFNCKTKDVDKVVHFCNKLKQATGIHTCNHLGMLYEYFPQVYRGYINLKK